MPKSAVSERKLALHSYATRKILVLVLVYHVWYGIANLVYKGVHTHMVVHGVL